MRPGDGRERRSVLPLLAPAIVVVAGALLAALWDRLPERWPTHWGPDGQPDGFGSKTFWGVYGPLLMAAPVWLLVEGLVVMVRRSSRKIATTDADPRLIAAHRDSLVTLLRMTGAGLTFAFAALSLLLPLATPPDPWPVMALVLLIVFGTIALGLGHMVRAMRRLGPARSGSALEGWNGVVYRDPDDPRVWVPRPLSMGYTLNFARREAWLVLGLLLAVPILVVVLSLTLAS